MSALRACLILIAIQSAAFAADVELVDGRHYDAQIIEKNDFALTLKISGMRVQIPRKMIASIDESGTVPAPTPPEAVQSRVLPESVGAGEIKILPVTDGPSRVIGSAPPPPAPAIGVKPPPVNVVVPASYEEVRRRDSLGAQQPLPQDPLIQRRLRQTVDLLRNDLAVADARRILSDAGDAGLAALAEFGLYHESPLVRARAADMLTELGGRRTLKPLIEAFYAAAKPTIDSYQVPFMEALMRDISRLTGTEFYAYVRSGNSAPLLAQKVIDWWQNHYAELPPQLGEPKLEESSPEYGAELARVRGLTLKQREFAGFNYPPDWVAPAPPPGMIGAYPPPPIIPRSLELERNTSTSQSPAVEKPINTERDEPGRRRQEDYLDRMREAIRTGTYR